MYKVVALSDTINLANLCKSPRTMVLTNNVQALSDSVASACKTGGHKFIHLMLRNTLDLNRHLYNVSVNDSQSEVTEGELLKLIREGGVLLIDYEGSHPKVVEQFNSLFDDSPHFRGIHASKNLIIIGAMEKISNEYAPSVYSRFGSDAEYAKQLTPLVLPEGRQPNNIDLYDTPYWEQELMGSCKMVEGKLVVVKGRLLEAMETGETLSISGLDMADPYIQFRIKHIIESKELNFYGQKITCKDNFRLYQCETDPKNNINNKRIMGLGQANSTDVRVLHTDNVDQLWGASVIINGQRTLTAGWLTEERITIRVVSDLDDWIWHRIMHSGANVDVEVAEGLRIPACYKKQTEEMRSVLGVKVSLVEACNLGGTVVSVNDTGLAVEQIKSIVGAENVEIVDLSLNPFTSSLFTETDVHLDGYNYTFSIRNKGLIEDLEKGKIVVVRDLATDPALAWQFAGLAASEPYLEIDGQKVALSKFGGKLIVLDSRTQTIPGARVCNLKNIDEKSEIKTLLLTKFPQLVGEDFDRLWNVLSSINSLPVSEGNFYPSNIGVTFQRLVNILKQIDLNRSNIARHDWVRAIRNVVMEDYFEVPEMEAYILVCLRRAYNVNYQAENSLHYPNILKVLNQLATPAKLEDMYWQAIECLSTDQLEAAGVSTVYDVTLEKKQAGLAIIRSSLITNADPKVRDFFKMRFANERLAENPPQLYVPPSEKNIEEDSWDHRFNRALDILKKFPILFLKGPPGNGKSFCAKKLAEGLGFTGGNNEIFGPITTGNEASHQEIIGSSKFVEQGLGIAETVYEPKTITEFAEAKRGILIVDESNLPPDGFWNFMKGLTEDIPYLQINGRKVYMQTSTKEEMMAIFGAKWKEKYAHFFVDSNAENILIFNAKARNMVEQMAEDNSADRIEFMKLLNAKKVVFTGNQDRMINRNVHQFMREHCITMTFPEYSIDYLGKLLSNNSVLLDKFRLSEAQLEKVSIEKRPELFAKVKQNREAVINTMLELHSMAQRATFSEAYTYRDLEEFVRRLPECNDLQTITANEILSIFTSIYGGQWTAIQRQAIAKVCYLRFGGDIEDLQKEHQEQYLDVMRTMDSTNHHQLSLNESTSSLIVQVLDFLKLLDIDISNNKVSKGKLGMFLEGPSGRGKDAIIAATLRAKGYIEHAEYIGLTTEEQATYNKSKKVYFHRTAGPDSDSLFADIENAKQQGFVVIISEPNMLKSSKLEGELNDKLTEGGTAGFAVFLTMNSFDYHGREQLSSAFLNRAFYNRLEDYTQAEFQKIASDQTVNNVSKDQKRIIVNFHCWLRATLQEQGKTVLPTTRQLIQAVEGVSKGKTLEKSLMDVYQIRYLRAQLNQQLVDIPRDKYADFQESEVQNIDKIKQNQIDLWTMTARLMAGKKLINGQWKDIELDFSPAMTDDDRNCGGHYSPETHRIWINPDVLLSQSQTIEALYHEIGHAVFDRSIGHIKDTPLFQDLNDIWMLNQMRKCYPKLSLDSGFSQALSSLAVLVNKRDIAGLLKRDPKVLFIHLLGAYGLGLVTRHDVVSCLRLIQDAYSKSQERRVSINASYLHPYFLMSNLLLQEQVTGIDNLELGRLVIEATPDAQGLLLPEESIGLKFSNYQEICLQQANSLKVNYFSLLNDVYAQLPKQDSSLSVNSIISTINKLVDHPMFSSTSEEAQGPQSALHTTGITAEKEQFEKQTSREKKLDELLAKAAIAEEKQRESSANQKTLTEKLEERIQELRQQALGARLIMRRVLGYMGVIAFALGVGAMVEPSLVAMLHYFDDLISSKAVSARIDMYEIVGYMSLIIAGLVAGKLYGTKWLGLLHGLKRLAGKLQDYMPGWLLDRLMDPNDATHSGKQEIPKLTEKEIARLIAEGYDSDAIDNILNPKKKRVIHEAEKPVTITKKVIEVKERASVLPLKLIDSQLAEAVMRILVSSAEEWVPDGLLKKGFDSVQQVRPVGRFDVHLLIADASNPCYGAGGQTAKSFRRAIFYGRDAGGLGLNNPIQQALFTQYYKMGIPVSIYTGSNDLYELQANTLEEYLEKANTIFSIIDNCDRSVVQKDLSSRYSSKEIAEISFSDMQKQIEEIYMATVIEETVAKVSEQSIIEWSPSNRADIEQFTQLISQIGGELTPIVGTDGYKLKITKEEEGYPNTNKILSVIMDNPAIREKILDFSLRTSNSLGEPEAELQSTRENLNMVLKTMTNLRSLTFGYTGGSEMLATDMLDLSHNINLKCLDMQMGKITDNFGKVLLGCPSLEYFKIKVWAESSPTDNFGKYIGQCPNLKHLYLYGNHFSGIILKYISQSKTIQTMDLWKSEGVIADGQNFSQMPNLNELLVLINDLKQAEEFAKEKGLRVIDYRGKAFQFMTQGIRDRIDPWKEENFNKIFARTENPELTVSLVNQQAMESELKLIAGEQDTIDHGWASGTFVEGKLVVLNFANLNYTQIESFFSKFADQLSSLEKLTVKFVTMNVEECGKLLCQCPRLRELDLFGTKVPSAIGSYLVNLPLQRLGIGGKAINDELSKFLQNIDTLQELKFFDTEVTDNFGFENFSSLSCLTLRKCPNISNSIGRSLKNIPIEFLNISKNPQITENVEDSLWELWRKGQLKRIQFADTSWDPSHDFLKSISTLHVDSMKTLNQGEDADSNRSDFQVIDDIIRKKQPSSFNGAFVEDSWGYVDHGIKPNLHKRWEEEGNNKALLVLDKLPGTY